MGKRGMVMKGLEIYNMVRTVPQEAKKDILAGRLKGKTDINPMWRIKTLTEHFGPVGLGWYYDILDERIEEGANGEKVAFVKINLFVKYGEEWSKPIQGTGGSSFVANEKSGPYTSDECFKMALTDAISVSCKALGVGADVYFEKDRSKYDRTETEPTSSPQKPKNISNNTVMPKGKHQGKTLIQIAKTDRQYIEWLAAKAEDATMRKVCTELLLSIDQVSASEEE